MNAVSLSPESLSDRHRADILGKIRQLIYSSEGELIKQENFNKYKSLRQNPKSCPTPPRISVRQNGADILGGDFAMQ